MNSQPRFYHHLFLPMLHAAPHKCRRTMARVWVSTFTRHASSQTCRHPMHSYISPKQWHVFLSIPPRSWMWRRKRRQRWDDVNLSDVKSWQCKAWNSTHQPPFVLCLDSQRLKRVSTGWWTVRMDMWVRSHDKAEKEKVFHWLFRVWWCKQTMIVRGYTMIYLTLE